MEKKIQVAMLVLYGKGSIFEAARGYLTNGMGAIPEKEMPYTSYNLNNVELINLSEIQGKTVSSRVLDTKTFPTYSASTITDTQMNEIKDYIKNYGGIVCYMRYRSAYGNYFNSSAAFYNDKYTETTHAVTIIGWDDNYERENFYSTGSYQTRPDNDGAWIVKNSLEEYPIIYISYESIDIYPYLYGITRATTDVDYDNIYQYDFFGKSKDFSYTFTEDSDKVYLSNIFQKNTEDEEYLNEVSIYAQEGYTCKVYINPDYVIPEESNIKEGKDLTKNLIEVELAAGESETFIDEGYHTLEFAEPIELTGDYFVVIVEIQSNNSSIDIYVESSSDSFNSGWAYATYTEKCFYGGEDAFNGDDTKWVNFSTVKGDSTIKAFTTSEIVDNSLKEIVVTTAPEKDEYIEGETFDETGMVLTAVFNNGVSRKLASGETAKYVIENGEVLSLEKPATVSYTYEGVTATVEVPITVKKNSTVSLEITKEPDLVEYYEGEKFDSAGMEVTATLLDGTKKVIEDYKVENGENLQLGQETVTISYDEVTVELEITVKEKILESIQVTKAPTKTTYIEGQNFEAEGMEITATYNNGDTKVVTNYKVTDGENLTVGKNSVTISYTEDGTTKTTMQSIVVEAKKLESIKVTKVPNKTTYIEGQNFEAEGMEITATYNNGDSEAIEGYTVTDGNNLTVGKTSVTISYTEDGITKTVEQTIIVLEKLKISFEEYEEVELDNKNHIKHIKVNETIEDMKENITTNGEIKVYQGEEEITGTTEKLATGMTVKITLREESEEYTVIVTGDTNGDGEANLHDILAINKHRLNKTSLMGEYLLAGDVNGDDKVDLNDILKINRYRLGKMDNL